MGTGGRVRFDDGQLLRFLNEGQNDLIQRTRPIRKSLSFELTINTTFYNMPSDFLYPLRVTRDYLILPQRSIQRLDKNQEWETVNGLPISYFIHFASRTKLGVYPWPLTSSDTGTIRMDYVASATSLVLDADEPYNGIVELQPYGYILAFYCAYRAALIDAQVGASQAYYAEYSRAVDWFNEAATARPRYRPSMVGGGPRRRP